VLGVGLFAAFWVVIGLALFFVAIRGGVGGARAALQTQTRGGRRFVATLIAFVFVGFGVALPLAILTGNHANANSQVGGIKLNPAEKRGRLLFGQHCGVCHTLAAANATGKVGPNLDQLRPPATLIYNTIINGCVQNPPPGSPQACLGYGTMPAGIIQPQDAKDVSAFVAKVAGRE
jgi:mono/diheme cytochrome c family protein